MKKFAAKNIIIIISFILTAIFIFTFLSPSIRQLQIAQASESTEQTKVKYFEGYGKYADAGEENADNKNEVYAEEIHEATRLQTASDDAPSITVLVHGQGGNASAWSNNGKGKFAYDSTSLIEVLRKQVKYVDVYWARMAKNAGGKDKNFREVKYQKNRFFLTKLSDGYYDTDNTQPQTQQFITKITDVGKHIIIVFESALSESYHRDVYQELHSVVDRVSYDILCMTGRIPKVNFISHSRGGIISMLYAAGYKDEGRIEKVFYSTDSDGNLLPDDNIYPGTGEIINGHPFNVDSLYSMGTPYIGTNLGIFENWNIEALKSTFNTESAQNILDTTIQQELKYCWERAVLINPYLKLKAIAGEMDFSFLPGLLADDSDALQNLIGSPSSRSEIKETIQGILDLISLYADEISLFITTIEFLIFGVDIGVLLSSGLGGVFVAIAVSEPLILALETVKKLINEINEILEDIEKSTQDTTKDYDWETIFTMASGLLKRPFEKICRNLNIILNFVSLKKDNNVLDVFGDLFVDSSSQSAMGFSNVENYKRLYKYSILEFEGVEGQYRLTEESASSKNFEYKKTVNNVGIPHNLETRDSEIINYIKEDIVLSHPTNIYQLINNGVAWTVTDCYEEKYNSSKQFELVIPNKSSDRAIDQIGESAFEEVQEIVNIQFSNDIKKIGKNAFRNAEICGITFENGSKLQTIDESAFNNCDMLGQVKGIEFPSNLEVIQNNAFYSCDSLFQIIFANDSKLTTIGKNAFFGCQELTEIQIPSTVTSIGDYAFFSCTNLQRVNFEKDSQLKVLKKYLFAFCKGLNTIVIPKSITEIETSVFYSCTGLNDVIFEEGSKLTTIGSDMFRNCKSLKKYKDESFEIPENVTFIGDRAFQGCENISRIDLPYKLTSLGEYVFSNCTGLGVINISNNINYIGEGAFYNWSNIQTIQMVDIYSKPSGWSQFWDLGCEAEIIWNADKIITDLFAYKLIDNDTAYEVSISYNVYQDDLPPILQIPTSYGGLPVKRIADYAFALRNCIYDVEIPDSIVTIGTKAFYLCPDLESISFSSNSQLKNIKDYAFSGSKIEEIIIPASVTDIGKNVFSDCTSLETIGVESSSNNFSCENGVLYNKTKSELIACPLMYSGNLVIPTTVTKIQDSAFVTCNKITSIVLHDGIDYIGEYAFYNCSALSQIEIPDSVKFIGYGAFFGCNSLASVNVESTNTEYSSSNGMLFNKNKSTLIYCPEAKSGSVVVLDSVTSINEKAFNSCTLITKIHIPNSVKIIGDGAFVNCTGLTEITFDDVFEKLSIGEFAFENCSNLVGVSLPIGIQSLSRYVFSKCLNLVYVYLPEGLVSIGERAFSDCMKLESMIIPDSVIYFGNYIFDNCEELTEVKLPSGITVITEGMFNMCSSLSEIFIASTVTDIKEFAFVGCGDIDKIIVEDGNEYFEDEGNCLIRLSDNTLLLGCKNSFIPDYVEVINKYAFYYVKGLAEIKIPSNVTKIERYAFYACVDLVNIQLSDSIIEIEQYAFGHCSKLESITLPNNIITLGKSVFTYCNSLTIYTELSEKPKGWDNTWNLSNCAVVWGCTLSADKGYINSLLKDENNISNIDKIIKYPYRAYYDFGGWYTNSSFTGTSYASIKNAPNNVRYYIKWIPQTWTVSFQLNGGYGEYDSIEVLKYTIFEKPLSSPAKENYIFKYWALSDDLSKEYDWDKPITEDIVLVAVWELKSYSVVFDLNGGNADISELTVQHGATIDEPSDAPQKSGYFFKYWALSADLTKEYDWQTPITGDVTLVAVWGQITTPDGLKFTLINNGAGYEVSKGSAEIDGVIELPSAYNGKPVIKIASNGFLNCSNLSGIIIPSSVTAIGKDAFKGTAIWDDSNDVVYADKWVVGYKLSIGDLVLKSDTIGISDYAFYGKGIVGINLPSSLKCIGSSAFQNCNKLTEVIFADNVVLESIGSYAFANSALTSISITETVKTIGNRAFDSCKDLTNITVEPENTVYKSDGNCLIRKTDNVLLQGCKNSVIPNYITIIGERAFSNISSLTSITIPYGVEEIGDYAFSSCSSLTSIILPSSVTAIGTFAFYYCSNLSEIELPDSVISLGKYAFAGCKNLIEVTLPDNLVVLKTNTFYGCSALSNIVISENLETIENDAFSGCYNLTVINIPKNIISIGNSAFYDCRNLTAINVDSQNSAYSSVDGVLYDKSQTVLICYPVKKFGEIAMQSGITEIGSYAFFGNGMTQIIIPASVTTIGDYAFSGCGDLTGVYFESGSMLIDLGIGAFEGCLNLTGIILPSGVTELSSNLFANCENILYVTFEGISNLEIISDTAFYCCYNLLAFRIPETVTSIGNDAFGECYSIADITIPCDVMYVGANAFSGWSSEQTIRVSSEYIAYGYWDYYWSDNCEAQIVWEEAIVDYSYAFEYNYIEDEEGNYGYEISAGSGYILELNYVVIPAYFEGIELCHVHRACQYLF